MNYFPAGTVYGTLLNFRAEWDTWAPKMSEPPYKAPPRAPVLYVKPANTWSADGAPVPVPRSVPRVEVGATIALVIGARGSVAGYVLMNDLSVPHDSYFRPPVKFKCLDGFLGIGSRLLPAGAAIDPARFELELCINGELRQRVQFSHLKRDARQLLADVTAFMTLEPGDVLMLGCDVLPDGRRPLAAVGERIELRADGFGTLSNTLVAEDA